MSTPHNPARLGETWNPARLAVMQVEIEVLKEYVTLSGGWAWHYMTPAGHIEYKHAHDHKDADLFVAPERFAALVALLKERGYERIWTRFDNREGSETFYRYAKTAQATGEADNAPIKVMLDVFVEIVPSVEAGGMRVVEPNYLLSLYGHKHTSDLCFAVRIARRLLTEGQNPVGHPAMGNYRAFLTEAHAQRQGR